ncbi:MAG: hypothetical protein NT007_05150, partial [Candidatus Kapabacteria bacterium]|nr:hypothetical protein [Candidatus Kapabacteria bacterium]
NKTARLRDTRAGQLFLVWFESQFFKTSSEDVAIKADLTAYFEKARDYCFIAIHPLNRGLQLYRDILNSQVFSHISTFRL